MPLFITVLALPSCCLCFVEANVETEKGNSDVPEWSIERCRLADPLLGHIVASLLHAQAGSHTTLNEVEKIEKINWWPSRVIYIILTFTTSQVLSGYLSIFPGTLQT